MLVKTEEGKLPLSFLTYHVASILFFIHGLENVSGGQKKIHDQNANFDRSTKPPVSICRVCLIFAGFPQLEPDL